MKGGEARRSKKRQTKASGSKKSASAPVTEVQESFSHLNISESEDNGEAECPDCGLVYGSAEVNQEWVQCDGCGGWWDMVCAGVDKDNITQTFFCSKCM